MYGIAFNQILIDLKLVELGACRTFLLIFGLGGMKLLEIGFGFGSLAHFLATKYDVHITAAWHAFGAWRHPDGTISWGHDVVTVCTNLHHIMHSSLLKCTLHWRTALVLMDVERPKASASSLQLLYLGAGGHALPVTSSLSHSSESYAELRQ